jgi:hypothetical protein
MDSPNSGYQNCGVHKQGGLQKASHKAIPSHAALSGKALRCSLSIRVVNRVRSKESKVDVISP